MPEDTLQESKGPTPHGRTDFPEPEGGLGRSVLSVLFWLWVGVSGISLSLLGILLFLPFNPWVDPRRHVIGFVSSLWGKAIIYALPGIAFRVDGRNRLSALSGPVVFCPNHQSVADIPLLLTFLPLAKFLVRADVFSLPVMGLHLRLCGYIRAPSKRGEPGPDPLLEAESWLRRGCNIVIFPEGTRSPDIHRLLRFRRGAFDLAQRAGVPLVPVAIQGTGRVIGKGKLRFRFTGRIRVQLLEPLWVTGDARQMAAQVRDRIQHAIDEPA
ncbi:MAG: lysophospholipid acyltransferase family protein [Myxococcaceae bacterium]